MMIRKFETYYVGAICALIATIILLPKLVVIGIILLGIIVLIGIFKKFLKFSPTFINVLIVLFYLMYLFYTVYTRDQDLAVKYLEYKLSFIVFPILFSFTLKERINLRAIAICYVFSTLLLGILGLVNSTLCYLDMRTATCWITGIFSFIHHPSYASIYFSLGIICVWYLRSISNWNKWLAITLTLTYISFIFLTLSLAGILFLLFMLTFFSLRFVYKRFGKIPTLITIIILPATMVGVITFEPHVRWEFVDAKDKALEYFKDPSGFLKSKKDDYSGSNSRLIMWTVAAQGIMEYPLGIGTANTDEFLGYKLRKIELNELANQKLNPHNQFLQTWLEIGFFGFLILVSFSILPLIEGIRNRNYLLIFVSLILLFNMLFESILQRQSGIVFFAFVLCFLMSYRNKMKMSVH